MKKIEMNINYAGSNLAIEIMPEADCAGTIYPVEANGKYVFSFLEDEEGEWTLMREKDSNTPKVENDLYESILKKLHYEIMYVA